MKKKILVGMLTTVLLLLTVGLSYSYFTGKVNGEDKELLISSKNVRILFTDSREIANNGIKPGWSESKTFSVKNESNDNFNYNIVFENLVNTFVTEGFLQYKITSTNGYNMTGYLDIPKSDTPKTVVLAYDIDLPVDTTHEYTIEFVYHDSETVDQSEDMGKIFEGNLAIIEGSANPNIKYTVTMNSDNGTINPTSNQAIKYENLEFEVTANTGFDINSMSVSCEPVANTVITGNKIKVNDIRQNHNCTVSFDKELYTVNIVVNNGESDALNKVVEYGGSGTATITPNYGYTLSGATIEGPCSIEGETLNISNVQSNGTCTVNLAREKYNVTLTGVGIETSDSPKTVEYEGSTTINFTLSDGYELGDNVVNCDNEANPSISGNVLTVSNVTANTTCTLSPVLKSYDVTLVVNGGTPASEVKSIEHNGSGTFNISASTGYTTNNPTITCTGNATGSSSESTVTISGVTTGQTCTVTLKKNTYTVNVSSNNTSYGTVDPTSSIVNHGDSLVITLTELGGAKYKNNNCSGTVSGNKMTISNITSSKSCTVTFIYEVTTLANKIKKNYSPNSTDRPDLTNIYDGEPGLYTNNDDQGTTYYFSGDGSSMNNWVSFAGKMWRIIRINGNGSVRLLYAGDGSSAIDIVGIYGGNTGSCSAYYVGWKYGYDDKNGRGDTESRIFKEVKSWFNNNIVSLGFNEYIDTNAIYCNDRELTDGKPSLNNWYYAATKRLYSNGSGPTLKCYSSLDRFTDGFGLMTADEVVYAGGVYGVYGANNGAYYYLAKDGISSIMGTHTWWTMTPSRYSSINGVEVKVFGLNSYGGLFEIDVCLQMPIRPVISLKSSVLVTSGTGSGSDPYTVSLP